MKKKRKYVKSGKYRKLKPIPAAVAKCIGPEAAKALASFATPRLKAVAKETKPKFKVGDEVYVTGEGMRTYRVEGVYPPT